MTPSTLARPRAAQAPPSPLGATAAPPAGPGETPHHAGRTPRLPTPAPDWSTAACAGSSAEWVPDTDAEEARAKRRLAPICAGCPIRVACLAWAMRNREMGVWAGTTTEQRKSLRRAEAEAERAKSAAACTVDGCLRPRAARGLCGTHYSRQLRGIDLRKPVQPRRGQAGVEKVREGEYLVPGPCGRAHLAGYLAEASGWSCSVCAATGVAS